MNCAIITVGDELLTGSVCDTNTQWLGGMLYKLGFPVRETASLPDDKEAITRKLRQFSNEYSLIIVSGGLGPTSDDLTRESAAEAFYCSLELQSEVVESIRRFFASIHQDMPASNRKQALIPKGARLLPNPCGTAPGFCITRGEKHIVFLPGVPSELKAIFNESIAPWLTALTSSETASQTVLSRTFNVCFIGESMLEDRIGHLATVSSNPSLAYNCSPGVISLIIKAQAESAALASEMLDSLERKIRDEVGHLIKGRPDEKLVFGVLRVLTEKKRYVYIRDMATGGLLGATICNAIGSASDEFSNALFAGSLVLGGTFSGEVITSYQELVSDARQEIACCENRVELVIAPDEEETSSMFIKCFVGTGNKSREFKLKTLPGVSNASRLVNASLASLYDMVEAI